MKNKNIRIEADILNNWKLKLTVLTLFLTPVLTATGAYYNLKSDIKKQITAEQVDDKYVRKESLAELKTQLTDEFRKTREDIKELRSVILRKPR